jgi:hypothetical protein
MKKPKRLFKERRVSGHPHDPINLRSTAFHEAGHAVAAVVLGLRLKWVDVKLRQHPNGGVSLGATNCDGVAKRDLLGKGEEAVMPYLVYAIAGVAAEACVNPLVSTPEYLGASEDWADAWQLAIKAVCDFVVRDGVATISNEEQERNMPRLNALMESARDAANRLVEDHQGAITEVAGLLGRRTRLDGAEVAEIVNSA